MCDSSLERTRCTFSPMTLLEVEAVVIIYHRLPLLFVVGCVLFDKEENLYNGTTESLSGESLTLVGGGTNLFGRATNKEEAISRGIRPNGWFRIVPIVGHAIYIIIIIPKD